MRKTVLLFVLGLVFSGILFGGNVQDFPGYDPEPLVMDGILGVTPGAETIASGLSVPWAMAFAPDGRLFVTERPGRVRVIENDVLRAQPVINMTSVVAATGEGGLCGIAVDPDFLNNGYLYVYHTYRSGGSLFNRVVRLVVNGSTATIDTVIVDGIPGGTIHDGGRIKIGPDGLLYIGTGEGGVPTRAQDLGSLGGKILRVNLDGSAPADNPFPDTAPLVYSYGHRNVQGLDWDASGQLYNTEHGPTGEFGRQANDEVNIIYPGLNYGWPNCIGVCGDPNYMDPIKLFVPQAVPPGGAAFYYGDAFPMWYGSFFFGTLGFSSTGPARHLHRLLFDDLGGTGIVADEAIARNQFGRIRDVVAGPDGYLYFTTSNRDGRFGVTPPASDDRVIRIRPQ